MNQYYPLTLGCIYELLPTCSKDWPIYAIVGRRFMYFNDLQEMELNGKVLRLHFSHTIIEFLHIEKQRWKFIGMYGEEEPVE